MTNRALWFMRAQTDLKHRLHQNVDFFQKVSRLQEAFIDQLWSNLVRFTERLSRVRIALDFTKFITLKKKGAGPAALSEGPEKSFTGRISVFKMTFPNLAGGGRSALSCRKVEYWFRARADLVPDFRPLWSNSSRINGPVVTWSKQTCRV